ncbi:MAG: hypothetical protein QXI87_08145 [Thermoproteota archaeon]
MDKVTDSYGLVQENSFLTCFMLVQSRALVFRVKSRVNRDSPIFNYGLLPLTSGESLPTYEGGSVSVPADGVMPARAYLSTGKSFPLAGAYDETDMWYTTEDYRDRLFHVIQKLTPTFLRVDVQIPKGVTQGRFQKDKVVTGINTDFGFSRGIYETVHLPRIHYGYRWANDTNIQLLTNVQFIYGEYIIETPKDADLIFNILTRKVPSNWVSLPINVWDPTIEAALLTTYGFTGFPLYGIHQREEALRVYRELLGKVKV